MRDYTKVPGYEHMTLPQARYNYLHDLLTRFKGLSREEIDQFTPCKIREKRGGCQYCSFSGFLGGDPEVCCAWRAEAQPDRAIDILETLLKIAPVRPGTYPEPEPSEQIAKAKKIAEHYGRDPQMAVAQEECAELIQASSKIRRNGVSPQTLDHLAEELADVRIMCVQLAGLFGVTHEVNEYAVFKLDRQLRRIWEEGDDDNSKE